MSIYQTGIAILFVFCCPPSCTKTLVIHYRYSSRYRSIVVLELFGIGHLVWLCSNSSRQRNFSASGWNGITDVKFIIILTAFTFKAFQHLCSVFLPKIYINSTCRFLHILRLQSSQRRQYVSWTLRFMSLARECILSPRTLYILLLS